MNKIIYIEGMSCHHCVMAVENALSEVSGVESVKVDLKEKKAKLKLENVSNDELKTAIIDAGYEVIDIKG